MCAKSKECRLVFDGLSRIEDRFSAMWVCPASGEMGKPPREALDPNYADNVEFGCLCFVSELVGVVEVCRREPVRSSFGVAVLTICEVALNDSAVVRVEKELPGEAVEKRSEAGDSGYEQFPTGTNDPPRLASAFSLSSRSVRWYKGPKTTAASNVSSSARSCRASPTSAVICRCRCSVLERS